jgi:hypothetical protein
MPKIKEVAPTFIGEILRSRSIGVALASVGIEQVAHQEATANLATSIVDPSMPMTWAGIGYTLFRIALAWFQVKNLNKG